MKNPVETPSLWERVPIQETTRAWLCFFAAGDWQRPLPGGQVDWDELFREVDRNGLLGLAHAALVQGPGDSAPPAFREQVRKIFHIKSIRATLAFRRMTGLLARLAEAGLDYLVVKGPALAYTVYPEPGQRFFNDLDLVVREQDGAATHQLLVELGFKPEMDWSGLPPKLTARAVPYELKYWHEQNGLLVEVHYDDLLNAGLASRDVIGFWERARTVRIEGVVVKILSVEDQLIHLCMHAHYHGYTRMNWLSDIAFIMRDQAGQIDYPRLLQTVRTEEAQVGVYYSLYFLERLLAVGAPAGVLAALRPDRFRRWWHERYMPEARVLSWQPMPRPDFSFYFLPLLKRLLPDLLVMGRRREKLAYLLRLLCPPQSWLRYYYQLDPNQPVGRHYLLHPLKLVYHYLTEIFKVNNEFRAL